MTGLQISEDLELPLDAATETFGILAKKGAGKSNAAVVMAEQMHHAGIPWVAIDPKGDWWGLRASGDGTGPGLPIVVFGGRHGDVPLEPTAGALLADLVLERGLTCVLDVSEFTKADVRRFLLAFAERLYRQAVDEPLHLFLEEAHEYLPQMVRGDDANLVSAWQRIVKQGRFKGIGCTLVSQRSAALNKDVLTQVDTLIVLRTTSPQDRAAVKAWVDVHAESHDMLATLPSLESGEAWVWSPEFLGDLIRIRFYRRSTFDSGATPKVGQKRKTPATLADVDLAAIKEQMAETIEKAKAEDPKELRKRVAQLERDLAAERAKPTPEPTVERVSFSVVSNEVLEEYSATAGLLLEKLASIETRLNEYPNEPPTEGNQGKPTTRRSAPRATQTSSTTGRAPVAGPSTHRENPPSARETRPAADGGLSTAQRRILTALAQHGPKDKISLAILTGYSHKGGGFNNPLGSMRSAGYVTPAKTTPIAITEEGLDALGDYEPLPTGRALLDWWMPQLSGAEKKIVSALSEYGPMEKVDLADAAGYEPSGGGFNNPLGHLRTLGIITAAKVSPIALAPEMGD